MRVLYGRNADADVDVEEGFLGGVEGGGFCVLELERWAGAGGEIV